jgi:GT2 family glycosyltransferase
VQNVGDACRYGVAIPAKNAAAEIGAVLDAVMAASPPPAEIVVFDDGSTDGTAEAARRHGVKVLRHEGKSLGPARARNRAVAALKAPIILFVDADVVIEPDAPRKLCDELKKDRVAAAFGAYGEIQAGSNLAARYANLRHHYFHVHGDADAETFWTGLGAVRRDVFEEVGGFDSSITKPAMEDIELGFRLRRKGYRIRIATKATGTHLKDWTVRQLWRDDIFSRAIPWSGMIVDGKGPATLNASRKEQIKAVLIHTALLLLLAGLVFSPFLALGAFVLALFCFANQKFWSVLFASGGWAAGLAGMGLHTVYYLYSSIVFGGTVIDRVIKRTAGAMNIHWAGDKPKDQLGHRT